MAAAGRAARRAVAAVGVLTVVALAVTGCGGAAPSQAGSGHAGSARATSTARPGAPAAHIPTGAQLGHLLLSAHPPAGWRPDNAAAHNEQNTGPFLQPANGPQPGQYKCTAVGSGTLAMDFMAWWNKSEASITLQYPADPGPPQVDLTLGAFEPGYAAKTIDMTAALASRCRSFKDKYMYNYRNTTSTTVLPHLGNQNLYVQSVAHTPHGKITDRILLVRVGNDLVGVDTNNAGGGNVRPATVKGFAGWLMHLLSN